MHISIKVSKRPTETYYFKAKWEEILNDTVNFDHICNTTTECTYLRYTILHNGLVTQTLLKYVCMYVCRFVCVCVLATCR